MKCYIKENENGEIVIIQEVKEIEDVFEIETLPIHKSIWIEHYVGKPLEEGVHFRLSETMIDYDTFQLVAYPMLHSTEL